MNKKILIIDDDEQQLHLTQKILSQMGKFETATCQDPSNAIEVIRKEKPDLVLLDIMMPKLDGFMLCKAIRNTPDIRHVKIVIYSAKIFDTDRKKALQLGADAFISKIIESHKLVDTIQQLLGSSPVS